MKKLKSYFETPKKALVSTLILLAALACREEWEDLRWSLGLDRNSRVLCVSTEGDTDQENYRRVLSGEEPLTV